jgi:hypothetical protein
MPESLEAFGSPSGALQGARTADDQFAIRIRAKNIHRIMLFC